MTLEIDAPSPVTQFVRCMILDQLRERAFRALSKDVWVSLARQRGVPLSQLARKAAVYVKESTSATLQLRACSQTGAGIRIDGTVRVSNQGTLSIGNKVKFASKWAPVHLACGPRATLSIGQGSGINYGTMISAARSVTIGQRVMIGNYCVIADSLVPEAGQFPFELRTSDVPALEEQAVDIGDDVWLAVRVTVLPGSRIGRGTIVAAGSVVQGEIPAGVVVGGVPARVLRQSGSGRVDLAGSDP